ncbi:DUF1593 domain-containing protein [Actinacidiphila bryophytorum]|uniref:DUF1593 domain-containing protein n=1 Tax=Actinacidiphila bryophytorum TaxID=1436133 RepID=A0A9W4GXX7_9ACTN|nr:DUF1593 domain-containing protein [Actinacidiphila bryophytorum]MBM9438388.1 DUF1593 domain-containing protein [Actinacidiphila bryophytorum]MBN6543485.1 DUF1593 domain-containing protein [Actinacidiphila bryophytorum]CAG7614242.1 conserved exported hypothetical protein [Actinacidiphila bryophytorum]
MRHNARLRKGTLALATALALTTGGTVAYASEGHSAVKPAPAAHHGNSGDRPHVILSTDMPPVNGIPGGEAGAADQKSDLDDVQTMVRFLAYADDFHVDGLIASSGTFANYANKQNILDVINAYGQVYPNLKLHDANYPTPDSLRAVTKQGRDGTWGQSATNVLGAGKDSEASDYIISVIDNATTPVWFVSGGGPRELGQALWKVQNTRSAAELNTFVSKIRAYFIDDQDGSAAWMRNTFPGLFVITNKCYWGMANTGPYDGTWLKNNVTTGHGALGADYPLSHWTYNDQGVYEGDSPDFLYLLSGTQGLSDLDDPALGGWGGRFQQDAPRQWSCAPEGGAAISRWEDARNQDFANRMDWAVKPYEQANHNPVARLNGHGGDDVVHLRAAAGSTVRLRADGSTDPDGNTLSYRWYQYPTTAGATITGSTSKRAELVLPDVPGTRVDVVLEVTDDGSPGLTSYRRLIVDVR